MTTRALLMIGLLFLGTAGGFAYSPPAQARAYVDIDIAPPAPRYEQVIVRPGYAWTPGYWRWNNVNRRHVWVGGVYVVERPGYRWRAQQWNRGRNGRWRSDEGRWDRDDGYGRRR